MSSKIDEKRQIACEKQVFFNTFQEIVEKAGQKKWRGKSEPYNGMF